MTKHFKRDSIREILFAVNVERGANLVWIFVAETSRFPQPAAAKRLDHHEGLQAFPDGTDLILSDDLHTSI